jgi:hypothetical protein
LIQSGDWSNAAQQSSFILPAKRQAATSSLLARLARHTVRKRNAQIPRRGHMHLEERALDYVPEKVALRFCARIDQERFAQNRRDFSIHHDAFMFNWIGRGNHSAVGNKFLCATVLISDRNLFS